jgi:hypothetical protein
MNKTAKEVIAFAVNVIDLEEHKPAGDFGQRCADEAIKELEAAGFIIQHRDCLPYKTQQQADQVLEAFRIRMGLG